MPAGGFCAHFDGISYKSFGSSSRLSSHHDFLAAWIDSRPVWGGDIAAVLPEACSFLRIRMVIYSLLLIILMITRPQGWGARPRLSRWARGKRKKSRTETEEITAEATRVTRHNKATIASGKRKVARKRQ